MDQSRIGEPLKQFIKNLSDKITVDRLIIFGSYAGSTEEKESDIDVIVVSSDFKKLTEDQRLHLLYRTSRYIEPDIHPWGVTPQELDSAHKLSLIGHARQTGQQFIF